MTLRALPFAPLCWAAVSSGSQAATIRVPIDAASIQAAISLAVPGDVVTIECGTYFERLTLAPSITLESASGDPSCVVVDAQGFGRAVFANQADGTTLRGLTFANGFTTSHGAGLYAFDSDLVVVNCVFEDHHAGNWGGGVAFQGTSSPTFEDCTFRDNHAGFGGGAYLERGSATFLRCRFEGNEADHDGGGVDSWSSLSTPHFEQCTFVRNRSLYADGGAAACNASRPRFVRCTFYENEAARGGSALHCYQDAKPVLLGCILAFGLGGGSVTCATGAEPQILCCDLWGNVGGDWMPCIRDQGPANRNLWRDPGFCDAAAGDFSLRSDSPCVAPGPGTCGTIGAFDVGCAPVSVEVLSWGRVKAMHR
jgi:hypothetical protein